MKTDLFDIVGWSLPLLCVLFAIVAYSYVDDWLLPRHLRLNIHGTDYAVIQHGGLWMDLVVMTWLTGYLASAYRPELLSVSGFVLGVSTVLIISVLSIVYARQSLIASDGLNVDGRLTLTGVFHIVYALPVMWVILMTYFGRTEVPISARDMIITSSLLTVFFPVGVMKFDSRWRWQRQDTIQVGACIVLTWVVTGAKLFLAR